MDLALNIILGILVLVLFWYLEKVAYAIYEQTKYFKDRDEVEDNRNNG